MMRETKYQTFVEFGDARIEEPVRLMASYVAQIHKI